MWSRRITSEIREQSSTLSICGTGGTQDQPEIRQLNESVYEFHSPEKTDGTSPNVEVVFFHGGHSEDSGDSGKAYLETWTSTDGPKSHFWPKTWLAKEFPRARILSVSYDSSLIKGNSHGRLDLYCTGENLIQCLTGMQGNVAARDGCPLILVGHGLGGLVIKAVCLQAKERGLQTFLSNLKGILYYSTPHLGLSNLPAEFGGALAETLGWGNAEIARLNEKFRCLRQKNRWVAKAILAAGSSSKQLGGTEASVRFDVDYYYTATEDIEAICRPRLHTSISVTYLTELISGFVSSGSGTPLQNKAGIKRGLKSLLPFEDDKYYVPMQTTIDQVRNALKEKRIVVVHGDPGVGKSSLARHLALRFQEESQRHHVAMLSTSDPACSFPDGVAYLSCENKAHAITEIQRELLRKLHMEAPLPKLDVGAPLSNFDLEALLSKVHMEALLPRPMLKLDKDALSRNLHEDLTKHFRELSALVVLDDVWDRDLLQKVLVHSGRVKYLVTTQFPKLWTASSDSKTISIQNVAHKDAQHILANYAGFDNGVLPVELKDLADGLITATMSHPLALATLGTVIGSWDEASRRHRPSLKDELLECLGTDCPPSYNLTVHKSMMLVMNLLEDEPDAKLLLYTIVLFDGTSIPETFVRLFDMYTKAGLKNINKSRRVLEARGLVRLERTPVHPFGEVVEHGWDTLSIHGLRRKAILGKDPEEKNIDRITNFLDGDSDFLDELLRWGKRSDCDLAIAICALYGVTSVKRRAAQKMRSPFIWSRFDLIDELANTLRLMVSIMFVEGETSQGHKAQVAEAATEVFWMLFSEGQLDDVNMTRLLDAAETTTCACAFLFDLSFILHGTSRQLRLKDISSVTQKLLVLSKDGEEAVRLYAIATLRNLNFSEVPVINEDHEDLSWWDLFRGAMTTDGRRDALNDRAIKAVRSRIWGISQT